MIKILYIPEGKYLKLPTVVPGAACAETEIFEDTFAAHNTLKTPERTIRCIITTNFDREYILRQLNLPLDSKLYRNEFEVIYD